MRTAPALREASRDEEDDMTEAGQEATLQVLDAEGCYDLLATQKVGRLVLNGQPYPLIFPVNYAMDGRTIVFQTRRGTKLAGADHANVTFEIDGVDESARTGWDVVAVGLAEEVTEEHRAELVERTRASGVQSWASWDTFTWVRILPQGISGRRVAAGLPPALDSTAHL
jgi:nitroimidazol reductase NimA-like FMN-containing flavoprotein (pyridoxamine 5'-phosphate oxidase superfamily)